MGENVKVAVRVRPFNQRENARNAKLIISMSGSTTEISDPANKGNKKKFAFDYSYWSHDGFTEEANGYLKPTASKYADQMVVFNDLGKGVLANAWKGYNCSLFAYGQTGSGKSYSMVGYGTNKGIVPISCEELFKGIEEKRKNAEKGNEYQVTLTMLEIYNEQVRDLLSSKSAPKGGLKVRQHPSKGFYVDGVIVAPVDSYADIDGKIQEGTRNRTVAATNMNATSSRAHTIVTINFTQKTVADGQSMTKTSSINLVDLAGSERADSTGATGDRLKEGSAINQSLSTLGNVIKALADLGSGKKGAQVPYRDSVLTKLLKNALGGNSKTIMIAALSPADINYDETLSTLRFADRAKSIKTQAMINESPTDKLIRELREENLRLQEMLKGGGGGGAAAAAAGAVAAGQVASQSSEEIEEMKRTMEEQMKKNQEELEMMKQTWEQRMNEANATNQQSNEQQKQQTEKMKTIPHFWNLNPDPALNGMVVHFADKGKSRVGNKTAEPPADIQLNGLNLLKEHAIVTNKKDTVTIAPCHGAKIVLNGEDLKVEKLLHHNDRVLFGSNHLYVFSHPKEYAKLAKKKKVEPPTYEDAQAEMAKNVGLMKLAKGKSAEDLLLQEDLIEMMPMVNEANAMSEELDKKVKFDIELISPQARGQQGGRTEVCVKVRNLENGNEWMWDRNKFINRKYLMQEMYQNFIEGNDWDVAKEQDPFWEPANSEVLIGSVHIYLQSLAYLIEVEENLAITDFKGQEQGHLSIAINPCNKDGKDNEDDFVEDPDELIGKSLYFKVCIIHARGLPVKFNKSFCQFKFYLDDKYTITEEVTGTSNPDFKYEKLFSFKAVTKQLLEYLSTSPLVIEIWGRQKEEGLGKVGTGPTKALMAREKTVYKVNKGATSEKEKLMIELSMYKRRAERSEAKVSKIRSLIQDAKGKKKNTLQLKDVEESLRQNSHRLRAAVRMIQQMNRARSDNLGQNTSQACILQ
ncbi:kinesin-like protein KIF28 isoform X2 [Tubulanus polymorphus]|uniref:kinesin-like protein KIF28 isoform X2 n=1 Tax=Tubulanus polymorphus TaxID=672921 RepID=UPI003DA2ABC8